MNKIYHKFLIVFVIFVALGGLYVYFYNSLESEASLASSIDAALSGSEDLVSSDDRINRDVAFISALASLNSIKIDTTLFTNKAFQSLRDNTIILEPGNPGRLNPFAPITGENIKSPAVSFETN